MRLKLKMPKFQEETTESVKVSNKDDLTDEYPEIPTNDDDRKSKTPINQIFDKITANVSIDFNNQEVQDTQYAIQTMLERIVTKVNDRGIFSITRIQPVGSMAEKTSIWKYDMQKEENFFEYDFVAVLTGSIRQCIDTDCGHRCGGCIALKNAPVNSERPLKSEISGRAYNSESALDPVVYNELFWYEINICLSSLCNCLITSFVRGSFIRNKIKVQSTHSGQAQRCDRCTIDMPTGTLTVNTSICADQSPMNFGPSNCSLIFLWTSKANSLSAPGRQFLHMHHQITSMSIYVDFLPALESLKHITLGEGYENKYFIVPKHCNVGANKCMGWRKSSCMTEINALMNDESKTHSKCYQIIKNILHRSYTDTKWMKVIGIENYDVKTVIVRHCLTCSNSSDDWFECITEIFNKLFCAYDSGKMEDCNPSTTRYNVLAQHKYCDFTKFYFKHLNQLLQSLGDGDTTETLIQKLAEMPFPKTGKA